MAWRVVEAHQLLGLQRDHGVRSPVVIAEIRPRKRPGPSSQQQCQLGRGPVLLPAGPQAALLPNAFQYPPSKPSSFLSIAARESRQVFSDSHDPRAADSHGSAFADQVEAALTIWLAAWRRSERQLLLN